MTNAETLSAEAHRLEEDTLYTEKAHFGMATVWGTAHLVLGVLSALAAAFAGLKASTDPIITAVFAFMSATLTAMMTFLDPAKHGQLHHAAGIRYSALRGELRRFREIDIAQGDHAELRTKLEQLAAKKTDIMTSSPHTGGLAYRLAKRSVAKGEQAYAADRAVSTSQTQE